METRQSYLRKALKLLVLPGAGILLLTIAGILDLPKPVQVTLIIIGFIFFIAGAIRAIRLRPDDKKVVAQPKELMIRKLMEEGEWIEVDLMKCEVPDHGFFQEKEEDAITKSMREQSPLLGYLNDISEDKLKNKREFVHQTYVVHEHEKDGVKEKFVSPPLPIDRANLIFKLYDYKKTWIFVNPRNRSEYYFDLRFLFVDKASRDEKGSQKGA